MDTVREAFDELRQALKGVVNPLLAQTEGGHYAIALLVAIGSEALSRLQGFGEERVFVEMTRKRGLTPEMASGLYNALRNGIAHTYDKFIKTGDLTIELIVSWGQKKRLTVRRTPPGLFLNVRTMWEDLREANVALKVS